jgi:hypothetical protein
MFKESVQCDVCGKDVSHQATYAVQFRKEGPNRSRNDPRFVRGGIRRHGGESPDICAACFKKVAAAVEAIVKKPVAILG